MLSGYTQKILLKIYIAVGISNPPGATFFRRGQTREIVSFAHGNEGISTLAKRRKAPFTSSSVASLRRPSTWGEHMEVCEMGR